MWKWSNRMSYQLSYKEKWIVPSGTTNVQLQITSIRIRKNRWVLNQGIHQTHKLHEAVKIWTHGQTQISHSHELPYSNKSLQYLLLQSLGESFYHCNKELRIRIDHVIWGLYYNYWVFLRKIWECQFNDEKKKMLSWVYEKITTSFFI